MLDSPEGAWPFAAALREAFARDFAIEARELGLTVERLSGAIEQATFSVFLSDRNSGGAGSATRLFDDLAGLLRRRTGC